METWLQERALKSVWCNPVLDRRRFIKPCRVSPPEGDICQVRVSEHQVGLPDPALWYTVYQIGALRPESIGFDKYWSGWASAETLLNKYGAIVQVYNEGGRTLPLSLVWMRVLSNGNLILAVEQARNQINFKKEELYIRFYSGYFKQSAGWTPNHKTFSESAVMSSGEQMANFIMRYLDTRNKPGFTFAYVNGYPVKELTFDNVALWDYVEYVHDGSIKEVYDFAVKDLVPFNSTLDKMRKLILHPPKMRDEINYLNDIELYVFVGGVGRYYTLHKNADVRQLTHRDYAIPADNITKYSVGNPIEWSDTDNMVIRMFIRRSGMTRPLTWEANRIHELYKLNDSGIVQAMSGINAVVPEWKAAHLEQSSYVRLMSSTPAGITRELATKAYGYNSVAKYVADTPSHVVVEGNVRYVQLPDLLKTNSTVYEYDANGYLLGYYQNDQMEVVDRWTCRNPTAELIEVIEGRGTQALDIDFNATDYTIEPGYNHRFYLQTIRGGVPVDEWEDVTGKSEIYGIDEQGKVHWNIDPMRRQPAIWRDSRFIAYEFTEDAYDGTMRFTVQAFRSDRPGPWIMHFQPEVMDVWINGRPSIHGLDYHIIWPQIILSNKQYLNYAGEYHKPTITIRGRGQAAAIRQPEYGFVVDGLLSNNNRFDVRDDKVVRIVADGALRHRDDVGLREEIGIALKNSRNGAPYCISDPIIPLRTVVEYDTYAMHAAAKVTDANVENYLTGKIPQSPNVIHNPISDKHILFSPVLNKIIHDLINEILIPTEDPELNFIPTEELDAMLEPYRYLLDYDPVHVGVDFNYVEVQPHDGIVPIHLTELHYSIVERANNLWLEDAVDLTKLIKLQVKNNG